MDMTPFPTGHAVALEPDLRVVLAPNPSPMTYWGTNTYLLGSASLAVIDPGPASEAHLATLMHAIDDTPVSHILVTHTHVDHSPLAPALSDATGAPVYAFGDATAGRSSVMARLARDGLAGGGEGLDSGFVPDHVVEDGQVIAGDGWEVTALWTPGHIGNHLCFDWDGRVFCGDLVMGWASSMVSPPDGDLTQFMASCRSLRDRAPKVLYPGHGAPIADPRARIDWLIGHREDRTRQILAALEAKPDTLTGLTARIYTDVDPRLLPAAARNVFAHLVDLHEKSEVAAHPGLSTEARFSRG